MGISKVGDRFRARLYYKGTTYNIGTYDTHLQASRAINAKRKELKAEEELDHHVSQIWSQDKEELAQITGKKPSLLERLWRKIKR